MSIRMGRETGRNVIRLLPYIWRAGPALFIILLAIKAAVSFLPMAQIYLLKEITDIAASIIAGSTHWGAGLKVAGLQFLLAMLNNSLLTLQQYMWFLIQQRLSYQFDQTLAAKSAKLPYLSFEQPEYFDRLQRAGAITQGGTRTLELVMQSGQAILTLIGYFIVLVQFNWVLALVMILCTLPTLWINLRIGDWHFWLQRLLSPGMRRTKYIFQLLTGKEAAREIRLFQTADHLLRLWSESYRQQIVEQTKVEKKSLNARWKVDSLNEWFALGFIGFLLWTAGRGSMTLGAYVAISQVLVSGQRQMRSLAYSVSNIYKESKICSEFFDFLEMKEEQAVRDQGKAVISPPLPLKVGIVVDNLSFAYPSNGRSILQDVSFQIKPDQNVAIVGENGAGKTTLINCLLGLYDNYEGHIHYDGVELRGIDLIAFRARVSAVFQDYVKYQLTVRENIGLGQLSALHDDRRMAEVLQMMGSGSWLGRLEADLDTPLGTSFMAGQELSAGQWQKIALSRALYRNADLLVLDEPTASMDPLAEASVYEDFMKGSEGRTTIFISHRLASCRQADWILVLKEGKLVEQGTHDLLISSGGYYCQMYTAQARSYTSPDYAAAVNS